MCGKTSTGKVLAELMLKNFLDCDDCIEQAYLRKTNKQLNCRQIFRSEGEGYFRALESEQIQVLSKVKNCVIAVGGGAFCTSGNAALLKDAGHLIYLQTSLDILWRRTSVCGQPAYLDKYNAEENFYSLMKKRIPALEEVADVSISCGELTSKEIAEIILVKVKENCKIAH